MALATEPRRPGSSSVPGEDRLRGGFELWSWLFMRLSGILLLFLAVGHVLIMHVLETGVERVDFSFVVERWSSPFWRTWDWLMLVLALLHGINGVRVIVQDYVRSPGGRLAWNWTFGIVGTILGFLGTVVVFTFDPAQFR
jgi:succinate dehydrogenase / fumarate reductase membrane anchor subunit